MSPNTEHLDVLVVGAGLSGIGAGYHLQSTCPDRSYAILEARDDLGGTWDLFRYPGIRSDSDMYTLGFSFHPWRDPKAIADGPSILSYVRETAATYGIDRKIRYGHKVTRASWSSERACWTVEVARGDGSNVRLTCNFLFLCTGYYDYDAGYTPEFAGRETFGGQIVHPQHWPEDLDYSGKKVVVIGSGATAVTLVPEMARSAAQVTMLQRSPTYVVGMPADDQLSARLRKFLPDSFVFLLARWLRIIMGLYFFRWCRRNPEKAKAMILKGAREALGPDYDVEKHFTPRYYPWEQRLCLAPYGDLFASVRSGAATVVTDTVERFVPEGIRTTSGELLEADLIVTATGLNMKIMSGLNLEVDGRVVSPSERMVYKGMMLSGVPNMAWTMGYTNASWTLKCDLTCAWVARLLNHMEENGWQEARPELDPDVEAEPLLDFSSGYVQRVLDQMPQQGSRKPWRLNQNYLLDLMALRFGPMDDGTLKFGTARVSVEEATERMAAG